MMRFTLLLTLFMAMAARQTTASPDDTDTVLSTDDEGMIELDKYICKGTMVTECNDAVINQHLVSGACSANMLYSTAEGEDLIYCYLVVNVGESDLCEISITEDGDDTTTTTGFQTSVTSVKMGAGCLEAGTSAWANESQHNKSTSTIGSERLSQLATVVGYPYVLGSRASDEPATDSDFAWAQALPTAALHSPRTESFGHLALRSQLRRMYS